MRKTSANDCPLKIALVNAADAGGGAERSVLSLHQGLRRAGHRSRLYVGDKQTDTIDVVRIPYQRGLPGLRRIARWIESRTGWQDIYNPSFRNLLRLIPADTNVVHFNNLWGASGYADLSILPTLTRRIPGLITERQNWLLTGHCACFHDCDRWRTGCGNCPRLDLPPAIPKDGTRYNWARKKRIVQNSNLTFVGISDYVCNLARRSPIWAEKNIQRIYNGIDTKVFRSVGSERKKALQEKLGIPSDRVSVLLSGQTLGGYREGIATEGYQAINQLNDSRIIPVLVGKYAEEASANLVGDSVVIEYRTSAEEMAECYQACDITIVTSHVEAFGRIAAESQACGTPVVSFDTGGLSEVVKNNVGGISVFKGDLEGLVNSLRNFVDDGERRSMIGVKAVGFIRKQFDIDEIVKQHIDLYKRCMGCF